MTALVLESVTKSMAGKECWLIIAGAGTGSVVSLGFGDKKRLERPVKNPCLTNDERLYGPEYSILIYCAWRLSLLDTIVCSWRDSNEAGGPMLSGLELLRGKKLCEIIIEPIGFDLTLHFEDGLCFQIFCDVTNDYDSDDNYIFFTNEIILSVGLKSEVSIEQRDYINKTHSSSNIIPFG